MSNLIKATKLHTKGPWHYEYTPYSQSEHNRAHGNTNEIPCYRIYPCGENADSENWIAETNSNQSTEEQEANAILLSNATAMLKALHDIRKITINYKHLPTDPAIRLKRIADCVTSILNTTF